MNIEEAIRIIKDLKCDYDNEQGKGDLAEGIAEMTIDWSDIEAIETLLTAYEKEKGENVKLRLQDIPLIEGELKAYKDRVNELKAELEKEKEDNKRLRKCHLQYEEMTGIDLLLPEKEE